MRQAAHAEAQAAYGKLSVEDYAAKFSEASSIPYRPAESLREDWEIYTDEQGRFAVSYGCSCEKCGFEFSYQHKEQLDTEP